MSGLSKNVKSQLYAAIAEMAAEGMSQTEAAHILLGFAHSLVTAAEGADKASVWLARRAFEADQFAEATRGKMN